MSPRPLHSLPLLLALQCIFAIAGLSQASEEGDSPNAPSPTGDVAPAEPRKLDAKSTEDEGTRVEKTDTRPKLFKTPLGPRRAPLTDDPIAEQKNSTGSLAPKVYTPIALIARDAELATPVTKNDWLSSRMQLPDGTSGNTDVPPPISSPAEFPTDEWYSDTDSQGPFWSPPYELRVVPPSLLWEIPLANQREPRMYAKFTNARDESTIDTAIGGEFGIVRLSPESHPGEGLQLDGFAAVFTRFDQPRRLVTADYRAGVPLTYAKGPWQAKIAYEHTSSHLGDDYIEATGSRKIQYVRDEMVLGLARRFWDQVRLYGQYGHAFNIGSALMANRDRFDVGVEWSKPCPTNWKGRPFAALDVDARAEQDYTANTTVQLGWQWKNQFLWSMRLAFEYYNGKSPYGQFFSQSEDWFGFSALYDW